MAAFHVFVEGATDGSTEGLARLATAIGGHYGLPAADLHARLKKGRFRVKGNTDRATAETYVRDLERLGARCTIEEATAENSQRVTPIPFPAVRPATPPAGEPVVKIRPTTPALPPRITTPPQTLPPRATTPPAVAKPSTSPPPAGGFQSGLSAAFSGSSPAADLGALGGDDAAAFSLSSVDGADGPDGEPIAAAPAFEPPGGFAASIGPEPETATKPAKPAKLKDEPLDIFAPPDAQGAELSVDIADDEHEFTARKRASTPPPVETAAPNTPAGRKSQPSMQAPNAPARRSQPSIPIANAATGSVVPSKLGPLGDERVRFVAGVLLAIGLGFAPAHFIASMSEAGSFKTIDNKVIVAQQQADTPETYALLDKLRADQLDRKETEHRNAAMIGLAVWALVAAGLAFVWFKKVPWDRFE